MSATPQTFQETTPPSDSKKAMHCYAGLLARRPYLVITAVTIVASTCILISLLTMKLPSFQDPQMGFEPRGTILAQRETAWSNLMKATSSSGQLTTDPYEEYPRLKGRKNKTGQSRVIRGPFEEMSARIQMLERPHRLLSEDRPRVNINSSSVMFSRDVDTTLEGLENITFIPTGKPISPDDDPEEEIYHGPDEFFCGEPLAGYARVVYSSVTGGDLFTAAALRSMCRLEQRALRDVPHFEDLCERNRRNECCRSWSIGNYVALLKNRSSCNDITNEDVQNVRATLKLCAKFYYSLQLHSDCYKDGRLSSSCRRIPLDCVKHNAVYNMLYFLSDFWFLNPKFPGTENSSLTYAVSFLPMACSSAALPYFEGLHRGDFSDGVTQVVAMELGLKNVLFDQYLVNDTVFVGLAAGVILIFMWMYTSSFFITVMTLVAIAFSLGIAYFLYTLIFKIKFFPFMNLLTSVIIVGIGADDAFIYCKVWASAKSEKNNGTLVKLVHDTLHHAVPSMFVTSLTTAAAFFASYVSNITAIRCFSIFAGTTVLANFLLTITWLPATVVIAERWCSSNWCICIPPFGLYAPPLQRHRYCSKLCNALWRLHYRFADWSRVFFEKILPCIVIKPRYIWVAVLGLVATGSVVVTFYWPRLRLPDSSEFQVFASDHPFEQYDFKFRDLFWFEKAKHQDAPSRLPVRVVWGVMPLDNGDYLNPLDRGGLVLDETFDIAAPDSQSWLRQFCRQLRNQSFYQSTPGPLLPNCFIETFRTWMMQECEDAYSKDRAPCCKKSSFPFERKVFNLCVRRCIKSLYKTPFYYEMPGVAGPRFLRETGRIQVVVVEYDSKFSFTYSYNEMQRFVGEVDRWVSSQMATAPPGMRNGWFVSYMDTYDLQDSLAHGTVAAIGVAMAIAAVVLFLTTLNVLITLYAILTVACIIFVTVAALVLLGWKLNMLESVVVSVAIGLAVDFTLHYGIVYRLSSEEDRESSVIFSIGRMGSPIAMAAFTTFLAGLAMLPSNVLGYIRIGTFVMIVMTVSWLYSTLFFQSLLRLFGPQGRFGQFRYPSLRCCTPSSSHVDKTAYSYALSESTMSTSSIGFAGINTNPNESHELESLTVANAGGVVVGRSRSSDRLTVCGTVGGHRYLKHKSVASSSSSSSLATRGAARQRSGSMSAVVAYDRDLTLATLVTRPSRKVSLPTCSIDPSPRHVSITTSSTTIVFSDEVDRDQTA